jgi:hypothetical protein
LRDYNKEPIVVENRYLHKKQLLALLFFAPIALFSLYYLTLVKLPNEQANGEAIDVTFVKIGISMAISSLIVLAYILYRAYRHSKIKPRIIIHRDNIEFEYFTEHYELKTYNLLKSNIQTVSWGFFPYAILDEKDEIWITQTKDDKLLAYILSPLNFLLSSTYLFLFIIINFKVEKYVYLKFKGGIIAIPKNEYPSNENIKFEWKSLFNRHIMEGNYYAK